MVRCEDGVFAELIDKLVRCDDGDVSTARRLGLLRVEAVPELGRDRVLDRQRVDVARRQREDRGEDASNYLEEAPLRVRMDLKKIGFENPFSDGGWNT